jgi:hypothetical protein
MSANQYTIIKRMPWEGLVAQPSLISEEVDRDAVDEVLYRDGNIYRIAFMPSVLAWVAFDYTEDACNQAAQLRLNYKEQVRKIKHLRSEFETFYNKQRELRDINELNGIGLQEQFAEVLSEYESYIKEHVHYCKPQLSESMLYFYTSVYMALFAYRALLNYVFDCDRYLDSQVKSFGNRSVLLSQPREIYRIMQTMLGECKGLIRTEDIDKYASQLVEFVKTAEFLNTNPNN